MALSELQKDRVFQALSDSTRREILSSISRESLSVAELSLPFDLSAPAISKHLKVLENANLIERIKDGKTRRFTLNTSPLEDVKGVIEQLATFWNSRLDGLEAFLESNATKPKSKLK